MSAKEGIDIGMKFRAGLSSLLKKDPNGDPAFESMELPMVECEPTHQPAGIEMSGHKQTERGSYV